MTLQLWAESTPNVQLDLDMLKKRYSDSLDFLIDARKGDS